MSWTSLLSLRRAGLAAALIAFSPSLSASQAAPQLAPNAPTDSPVQAAQKCIWVAMDRAMQPYIAQARASWPQARQHYGQRLKTAVRRKWAYEPVILVDTPENVAKILLYRSAQTFAGWYEPGLPDRRRAQAGDVVLERVSDDGASEGSRRRRYR